MITRPNAEFEFELELELDPLELELQFDDEPPPDELPEHLGSGLCKMIYKSDKICLTNYI